MRNGKRSHKEVMALFEKVRERWPTAIREEIVVEGVYFTLARVSVDFASGAVSVIGEGIARRSGEGVPDDNNPDLAKSISLGRARVACAMKLANHCVWVKLRSLLMG
jgi:L-fucose isomerase-like protein